MIKTNNEKLEDFLIKYGKAVKEKINSQRIEQLRVETNGMTFQPKVSKVSEKIVQYKQVKSPNQYLKFDNLY